MQIIVDAKRRIGYIVRVKIEQPINSSQPRPASKPHPLAARSSQSATGAAGELEKTMKTNQLKYAVRNDVREVKADESIGRRDNGEPALVTDLIYAQMLADCNGLNVVEVR